MIKNIRARLFNIEAKLLITFCDASPDELNSAYLFRTFINTGFYKKKEVYEAVLRSYENVNSTIRHISQLHVTLLKRDDEKLLLYSGLFFSHIITKKHVNIVRQLMVKYRADKGIISTIGVPTKRAREALADWSIQVDNGTSVKGHHKRGMGGGFVLDELLPNCPICNALIDLHPEDEDQWVCDNYPECPGIYSDEEIFN